MRVGLIIYGSIKATTGGYIYDYHLVEHLRAEGVIVKIFSQQQRGFWGLIRNNFSKKLLQEVIEFSPDVLLEDEMNFNSLFIFNKKLKRKVQFPIISIVHMLQAHAMQNFCRKWIAKKIEAKYLNTVNGFIFNSIATQQAIESLIGNTNNSLIAYPGKDRLQVKLSKHHLEYKWQSNKLMLIFIGNLLPNKGLHLLLEALAEIEFAAWELAIVGGLHLDLKYTKKIFKMIKALKMENNIKIQGVLTIEHLKNELYSKHVLIVPSYYESYGIVYTEVMGAGIPVIASQVGGVPEIITDKVNGFLIEPGDSMMLRKHLVKFINNRELLKKMSFSSLDSYEKFPLWNDTMQKIHSFLNQYVSK